MTTAYFDADEIQRNKDLQESTFVTIADVYYKAQSSNNRGGTTGGVDTKRGSLRFRLAEMSRPPIDKSIADEIQGQQGYMVTYPMEAETLQRGWWLIITTSPNSSEIGTRINIAAEAVTGTFAGAQRAIAYQKVR